MHEQIHINLIYFTLEYEQHFCPCSCLPAYLWTLCRGVDAAHRWALGGCWASYCGAPGAGHWALPPAAAGLLTTPLQTPANNREATHSLSLPVRLLRPDLLQSIADRRKSHLSPRIPGGEPLGHKSPVHLSACPNIASWVTIYPNSPVIFPF